MNATATAKPAGNYRWVICGLLFFSVAINYIDRLVIGILKAPLSEALGWSEVDYGNIAAAFSFAYAFGYLIGGRSMDRFGVKRALPVFVLAWSLAATAHGFVNFIGLEEQFTLHYPWFSWAEKGFVMMTVVMPMTAAGFMFARIALGLTEGANFPAAIKATAEWFPVKERAMATGLFNAGSNVGAILCPIGVPWMFNHLGWPATFYITGGLGFVWVAVWWWIYETPEKQKLLSPEELSHIREGQPAAGQRPPAMPWLKLLRYRGAWAFIAASVFAGPAWGFYQFFLPDFLKKSFSLTLQEMGWWTAAFYFVAGIGGVLGGWLAGRLISLGWSLNAARKVSLLCCALAVVPVFLAPFAGHVWIAVVIVGIAGSAHQGWSANLFSVVSDTMPREAISSVVGLGGFLCFFTGGFVNKITGNLLQSTGSYLPVFLYFSGMYVLSLIAIQLLVPRIGGDRKS